MDKPEYLIIGGGIIGCSLARELARVSRSVVVVERGRVGSAASAAAVGLLAPSLSTLPAGELLDLCFDSAALYASWVEELRQDGAADVGFRRSGLLEVWTDAQQADDARATLPQRTRPGRPAQLLAADEVHRLEPGLAMTVLGGVWYAEDAWVDPARLSREVARVAERNGVQIHEGEGVRRLLRSGDRLVEVHTAHRVFQPGTVVVAAGAWSGGVLDSLGVALPTRPVKGQVLLAECRTAPVRQPLAAGESLLVPRDDGRLIIGVTLEEAGFDERVTLAGIHTILSQACAVVPAIGSLELNRAWAGSRPATPDEMPFMGMLPPLHNLWVSTGHYRKGILLAPLCARLLAQSILANHPVDELAHFKPTRRIVQ
ncbi:MAG: glycine oxidase ThiO [Gemmataceae bacterium]